jgi:hypothetical protein
MSPIAHELPLTSDRATSAFDGVVCWGCPPVQSFGSAKSCGHWTRHTEAPSHLCSGSERRADILAHPPGRIVDTRAHRFVERRLPLGQPFADVVLLRFAPVPESTRSHPFPVRARPFDAHLGFRLHLILRRLPLASPTLGYYAMRWQAEAAIASGAPYETLKIKPATRMPCTAAGTAGS